jgi:hypothetical protein
MYEMICSIVRGVQTLLNAVGDARHSGGVRVSNTAVYYILTEWYDAGEVMPPSYEQAKN